MAYDLKGKFAIVTGNGFAISHYLTEMLLDAGCSVLLADLELSPEAEATLAKHPHPPAAGDGTVDTAPSAVFCQTDVASPKQLRAAWDCTLLAFGRVDVAVSGTSIFEPTFGFFWVSPKRIVKDDKGRDVYDPDLECGWERTLDVNQTAPVQLAKMAVKYWLQPENKGVIGGNLLWLASTWGHLHSLHLPLTFVSKTGREDTEPLAEMKEAFGIRISAVCPGPMSVPNFEYESLRSKWIEENFTLSAKECASVLMKVLQEPEYGDGSIVEAHMVGTKEDSKIVTRHVPLKEVHPPDDVLRQMQLGFAAKREKTRKEIQELFFGYRAMEESTMEESDIEESDIEEGDIEESTMEEGTMEEGDIEMGDIEESDIEESDIEESDIEESDMEESTMEEGDIEMGDIEESTKEENTIDEMWKSTLPLRKL